MKRILILALMLGACASKPADLETLSDRQIYDGAMAKLADGYYDLAAKDFEQIEYIYPYSEYGAKATLMAGYAAYRDKKYADAAQYFDKFVKHHPASRETPYAMYMIAISYYDSTSPITRDQKTSEQALRAMEMLAENFPSTIFAQDVKPKISILRNNLAAKEMLIAGELFRRRNLLAALNRYQGVVVKHSKTLFAPEAMFRSAEIYRMLGQDKDAENMAALLKANFPDSEWNGK